MTGLPPDQPEDGNVLQIHRWSTSTLVMTAVLAVLLVVSVVILSTASEPPEPTSRVAVPVPATISPTTIPSTIIPPEGLCPYFQGITCDGWVTDAAGVLTDRADMEAEAGDLFFKHGHEIAVILIETSGDLTPRRFADGIGNAWGVGNVVRDDGIVILVAIQERRTEIVTGPGLVLADFDLEEVAEAGNEGFGAGDFDAGLRAVLQNLDELLTATG
ncbi:MAG: TPM domain-containing protein [Deltaproteobacteria bacterium]|nr:TPM domain-containing protein [Deltaproteobacteria bacterium]